MCTAAWFDLLQSGSTMQAPHGSDSKLDTPSLGLVQEGIESALSLAGVGVWETLVPENLFSCSVFTSFWACSRMSGGRS
jgi:hypothetical protein